LALSAITSNLFAGDLDPQTQPAPLPHHTPSFSQGTACFTLTGAYAASNSLSRAQLETGSIGVGYYFLNNIAINLEAAGFWDQQRNLDSHIAETNLLLRHHLFTWDRFSILADVGGGVSYADHPTPRGGTYFNFSVQSGVGLTYRLQDNVHLMTGVRFLHFSNAQIHGKLHNPSINATEGYVGVIFTF